MADQSRALGRDESILPPEMEALRRRLVRAHNLRVMLMGAVVFGLMFLDNFVTRALWPGTRELPWQGLVALLFIVLLFFPLAVLNEKRDQVLARKWGFTCPHCGEPLYKAASIYYSPAQVKDNALCPKCHESVLPGPAAQ